MSYGYVYTHKNKTNGKIYVGISTQSPKRRFRKGQEKFGAYKSCPAFYNALLAHGWDEFETTIVVECDDQTSLNAAEEHYIGLYDCIAPKGYNTASFSQGRGVQSEETKKKISEKQKAAYLRNGPQVPHNKREHELVNEVLSKYCPKCKSWTPLTNFNSSVGNWDNLYHYCRSCHQENMAEYRDKNPQQKLTDEEFKTSYKGRDFSGGQQRRIAKDPEGFSKNAAKIASKSIKRTDPNTKEEKIYSSAVEAKRIDGFDNTNISIACKKKTLYRGYYWSKV